MSHFKKIFFMLFVFQLICCAQVFAMSNEDNSQRYYENLDLYQQAISAIYRIDNAEIMKVNLRIIKEKFTAMNTLSPAHKDFAATHNHHVAYAQKKINLYQAQDELRALPLENLQSNNGGIWDAFTNAQEQFNELRRMVGVGEQKKECWQSIARQHEKIVAPYREMLAEKSESEPIAPQIQAPQPISFFNRMATYFRKPAVICVAGIGLAGIIGCTLYKYLYAKRPAHTKKPFKWLGL